MKLVTNNTNATIITSLLIYIILTTFISINNNCFSEISVELKTNMIKNFFGKGDDLETLNKLTLLIEHIRSRAKCPAGLYPPLPRDFIEEFDITSTEIWVVIEAMADFLRDLEDKTLKKQALTLLNPLLLDSLANKVVDLNPIHALNACVLTVFDPCFPVIPEPSEQVDYLFKILVQSLRSNNNDVKQKAFGSLFDYANLVPEKFDDCAIAISDARPNYSLKEVKDDIIKSASYIHPITYQDLQKLRKKSIVALANEAILPENRLRIYTYAELIRQRIKNGEVESDEARCILLSGLKYTVVKGAKDIRVYAFLSFVPGLIPEKDITPEKKKTWDTFLSFIEREVYTAPIEESLHWIIAILERAVNNRHIIDNYEQINKEAVSRGLGPSKFQFRVYGTDRIIMILNNLLYRKNNNIEDIKSAVNILLIMLGKYSTKDELICSILTEYMTYLLERHRVWLSAEWFTGNSKPDKNIGQSYQYALIYYEISNGIKRNCD